MVLTTWEVGRGDADEAKGGQVYGDGGRLDFGW